MNTFGLALNSSISWITRIRTFLNPFPSVTQSRFGAALHIYARYSENTERNQNKRWLIALGLNPNRALELEYIKSQQMANQYFIFSNLFTMNITFNVIWRERVAQLFHAIQYNFVGSVTNNNYEYAIKTFCTSGIDNECVFAQHLRNINNCWTRCIRQTSFSRRWRIPKKYEKFIHCQCENANSLKGSNLFNFKQVPLLSSFSSLGETDSKKRVIENRVRHCEPTLNALHEIDLND